MGKLGVMIDCSRNAVMSVSGLKRFIDTINKMGYNRLLLYMEDVYEVENEPLFGYMRGRYTKKELKEIDTYAFEKGVEVVPCIQTLAHLNQIFTYGTYSQINDVNDILLVGEERTYQLIDNMFKTCNECFMTKTLHIGMDEAHLLGLGKYLDKHGYKDRNQLFLEHLNKVCDLAKKYQFKPMIWSDMFFHLAFNTYYVKDGEIPQWVREKVPKNVELVYWDYYADDRETYEKMIEKHLAFDNKVSFAGGAWKWLSFSPMNGYSIPRNQLALEACNKYGVQDRMITLWCDDGNECPWYAVLPSLMHFAECSRGNYDLEIIKQKFSDLFGENFDDFIMLDLKFPDNFNKKTPESNGAKAMFYNDPFLGKFDSVVYGNGEEVEQYKKFCTKIKKAKCRSVNYKYIFEFYERFTEFLSVKYDLGYRTRKAYQEGDKKGLVKIVLDYKKAEKLLKKFNKAFKDLWFADNKASGFDVQELRIGGLLMRIESCSERLLRYLNGEIETIEELEEKLVDYYGGETLEKTLPVCWRRAQSTTVNIL